jgi:hypothetical protein
MKQVIDYSAIIFSLLLAAGTGACAQDEAVMRPWPIPPHQNADWSLPKGVSDSEGKIAATMKTLFEFGLADPRGMPYHHVKRQENSKAMPARAWVLPASRDDPQRYAIGWNGLIYPVTEVGAIADLQADLVILREKGRFGEKPFANSSPNGEPFAFSEWRFDDSEGGVASWWMRGGD